MLPRAKKGFKHSPLAEPAATVNGGGHIRDTAHSHLGCRKDSVPAVGASGSQRDLEKVRGQLAGKGNNEEVVTGHSGTAEFASYSVQGDNMGFKASGDSEKIFFCKLQIS